MSRLRIGRMGSVVVVALLAGCHGKQEAPGDCEVIATHWTKLVEADHGDTAAAQRMYEVCKRERFGAKYTDCLRAATDVKQGIACGPKLSSVHRAALRAAHETAAKAPPPPPPPQQPAAPLVWPRPQPQGPAYMIGGDRLWSVAVDGTVASMGGVGTGASLVVTTGGDVILVGHAPVSVARLSGTRVQRLPSPKLRGSQVVADATSERVVVAASEIKTDSDTWVATYQNGAWSAPEKVAGIGAVTGVMVEGAEDLWVAGEQGLARRRGGTWKSWACPEHASCIYAALARRGTTPVLLIDDSSRWRTFIVDDKDELVVDMPKGVDWSSNGAGRNGVLVDNPGSSLRAHVGSESTSSRTDWEVSWRSVVDGGNRAWYRANGGLAVTDMQHETTTFYPSGAPLLPGAAEPESIAVVGSGPSLPPPQEVKLAQKVTGTLKVNGGKQASTEFKICPSMHDSGAYDPCAKSKPEFSGRTDAAGAFELANVPAGAYDLAMYMTTSDGKASWAVIRPGLTVKSGAQLRLGTLAFTVSEYPRIGP